MIKDERFRDIVARMITKLELGNLKLRLLTHAVDAGCILCRAR